MIINLRPARSDDLLTANRSGDTLTLNGLFFDFALLPDGATLPAGAADSNWIVGPVERINGKLHITLRLPHGPNPPHYVAFPQPIIDPPDGPISLPTNEEAPHDN